MLASIPSNPIYFEKFGSGDPVLILHGLFGSGENWCTIARELSDRHEVFVLDLRNHGQSFHSDHFNYDVMADDVMGFIQYHWLKRVAVIGHSMGGKTAMQFAFRYPDLVSKLVVVDIANKAYETINRDIIEALCALDTSQISKLKDADQLLKTSIPDRNLRWFLLKNLKGRNGFGYHWQINMRAIRNGNESLSKAVSGGPFTKPCLFIRGQYSDYIMDSDWPAMINGFPGAELKTIPNAGHWVHVDARDAFIASVAKYLSQ